MSDNIGFTPGSGGTYAADEVVDTDLGTVKVAYVKLMDGALNGTSKAAFVDGAMPVSMKVQYNATPPNLANGATAPMQSDNQGNTKVYVMSQLSEQQEAVSSYAKPYQPVNLVYNGTTGSGQILSSGGVVAGFFVNSFTGTPTIRFGDSTTSTITTYFGGAYTITQTGPMTLGAIAEFQVGCYLVFGGTGTADITFLVRNGITA